MRYKVLFLFFLMAIIVGANTLKDTVEFALENSPEYRKIEISFERSKRSWEITKNNYLPSLTVSGNDSETKSLSVSKKVNEGGTLSYNESEYSNGTDYKSLSYSQNLTSIKDYQYINSKINFEISELNFKEARQKFILNLANSFYNLIRQKERLVIEENSYKRWKNAYDYAVARFDSGAANKFAVLNAKLNLLNSESSIISQKDSYQNSLNLFKKTIGMELDKEFAPEDPLIFREAIQIEPVKRRDVKISERTLEIARINWFRSKLGKRPDIRYSATTSEDTLGKTNWTASLSYSFMLGKSDNQLNFDISTLELERARINHDLVLKQVKIEKQNMQRKLESSKNTIKIRKENLENAQESFNFSEISFQKGLISFIDLQDSQLKLTQAKQSYISALLDNYLLVLDYILTMGGDIEEHLQ
ncbi:MAG: hypothetical protein C0601_10050 [Candidatus Muiribacterium halophilum]|uniref:TolC family protein n=1 Tax=Muiribacterium halophilum TaxID=2053465 RepID=A0A2N5ZCX2_MUIH1|nr:MAG: hypothetical protein C0601_10050 [Candidatus Muirbacterium halophilum]